MKNSVEKLMRNSAASSPSRTNPLSAQRSAQLGRNPIKNSFENKRKPLAICFSKSRVFANNIMPLSE